MEKKENVSFKSKPQTFWQKVIICLDVTIWATFVGLILWNFWGSWFWASIIIAIPISLHLITDKDDRTFPCAFASIWFTIALAIAIPIAYYNAYSFGYTFLFTNIGMIIFLILFIMTEGWIILAF